MNAKTRLRNLEKKSTKNASAVHFCMVYADDYDGDLGGCGHRFSELTEEDVYPSGEFECRFVMNFSRRPLPTFGRTLRARGEAIDE